MKIFIPTIGREGKQITINSIKGSKWEDRTYLVCPKNERHNWKNIIYQPDEIKGIAQVRQWIIESSDDSFVCMCDDDIYFYGKNISGGLKGKKLDKLFDQFEKWLSEGKVFVGVTDHLYCNMKEDIYHFGPPTQCYAMNRDYLKEHNIRYDAVELCEDYHVPLSVLESGRKCWFTSEFNINQYKVNGDGGCSNYRDIERVTKACEEFRNLHPKFVKFRYGKNFKNQGVPVGFKLMVSWKKAFLNGRRKVVNCKLSDFI